MTEEAPPFFMAARDIMPSTFPGASDVRDASIYIQEPCGLAARTVRNRTVTYDRITGAPPSPFAEDQTMKSPIEARVAALESAMMQTEGAHYALHDLLAHTMSRLPDAEFRSVIAQLRIHSDELDLDLAPERVAAYRAELTSIEDEVGHMGEVERGLLTKIVRSVGGGR
ncbi:hypothetical protein [Novosphingobium gossypii]|uniref:hypothetical protein n=1 Tax=Novosphingobium gossypii TaxID=1604774 RepID=UPI003D23C33A